MKKFLLIQSRLHLKQATSENVDIIVDHELAKKITRVEVWDDHKFSWQEWTSWEEISKESKVHDPFKESQLIRLTKLKPDNVYDVRLLGVDENDSPALFIGGGIKTKG